MDEEREVLTRIETDLLGEVKVPAGALYGAQTARAVRNFPVGNQRTIGSFPHLIRALLLIKKSAALTNEAIGALPERVAQAIVEAADKLLQALPPDEFPVHCLHGGGGTSANMNVNEVLANLSEEILGGRRGEYRLVHPNDHVNLHQSTNDVYPTACHMAVISQWQALGASLTRLGRALARAGEAYHDQVRLARTCLQDAVDISFGSYLGGMACQVDRLTARLDDAVDRLHAVNLGGTICGRPEDAPTAYLERIIGSLASVTGDGRYRRVDDLFDGAQNPDELVAVSAGLEILARSLIKIASDFRLLSSGPEAGLGEIALPAVQPGSSIMPGKVNPVVPEFVIQIAFRVIGNHAMCAAGLDHGELDLNVWESSMLVPILEAMELLESGIEAFMSRCVLGMRPNPEANARHARTLIPRLTRLSRLHGYQRVTAICKQAQGDLSTLRKLLDRNFPDSNRQDDPTGASRSS
jgi:aspartate ammonia-lyase